MAKIPAAFTDMAKRRVYGRRLGRPLGASRQDVLDNLYPQIVMPADKIKEDGSCDFKDIFAKNPDHVVFEIGFGNGEHLKALMESDPSRNYIGAEPFINGMSAFLKSISDMPQDNIRVWMDDAITLVKSFKPESLDAIYVLNPDPWPKKKHHKRRIISQDNLAEFHRTLKQGGQLIMATDVDDLAEWMVTETMRHGGFDWQANRAADWHTMPENWLLTTRYAAKGEAAGRKETYLLFKKA